MLTTCPAVTNWHLVQKGASAGKGICCAGLNTRTESYITNKNLSIVFDKLSFETAITWSVPSFFGISRPNTKLMGRCVESMLGATQMHRPECTHQVVVSLMEVLERSHFTQSKVAACCAIKVGKPKTRVCLNKPVIKSHAKAATKDTLLVKHPLAECKDKTVTEAISQQKPKEQKHAMQPKKSMKKKKSQKLLGVKGGIRKK